MSNIFSENAFQFIQYSLENLNDMNEIDVSKHYHAISVVCNEYVYILQDGSFLTTYLLDVTFKAKIEE